MANSTRARSRAKAQLTETLAGPGEAGEVTSGSSLLPAPTRPKAKPTAAKPKFPLRLHATGQWMKKIRGKCHYFGKDRDAALKEYMRVKDDLEAGREPPPVAADGLTVKRLGDTFLTFKAHQVTLGELSQRTFCDYQDVCQRLADHFGKTSLVQNIGPADLLTYRQAMISRGWGPTTITNEVQRARVVLRFAFEAGLIDRPIRFGEFKRAKKSAIRRARTERGPRLFEAADLRRIIDAADPQLKAMILLAINTGCGNADVGTLPMSALDLKAGWLDYPRPKTGIERRAPLWPETIEAIDAWLKKRKAPKDAAHAQLVFVTKYGGQWHSETDRRNALSAEFRKLLERIDAAAIAAAKKQAKENGTRYKAPPKLRRDGLTFYALRHTFQTIADELGDYLATRRIMGHCDPSISDHYRERFADERLKRVSEHVRQWLFPATAEGGAV